MRVLGTIGSLLARIPPTCPPLRNCPRPRCAGYEEREGWGKRRAGHRGSRRRAKPSRMRVRMVYKKNHLDIRPARGVASA